MSFIKKNKKYLTVVGFIWVSCLILFVLVYVFLLAPQYKNKKVVDSRFAEVKKAYDSALAASKEETINKIKEQIKTLQDTVNKFTAGFEDSSNLTFQISQVANEKKVDSFSIRMQEDRKGAAGLDFTYLKESRIDIGFSGGFKQFASFLNALERNRPVVFVDDFKITRSVMEDSNHRVSMKLAVFVRKQQES
jgi:Tfp pilus assembly protein PilO